MSDGRPLFVGPLLHLRTIPALEGLAQSHLLPLASEMEEVLFQRGSWILEPDKPVSALFFLVDGLVSLGARASRVGPGEVLGFLEALSASRDTNGVRAETDVIALRLETDALRDICGQDFQILLALLRYVADLVTRNADAYFDFVSGSERPQPLTTPGSLDRVGRILALHRAPALSSRSMDALAEMAGQFVEHRFEDGVPIWDVGDAPSGYYVVCDGEVLVEDGTGILRSLGPGSVPGLAATLADQPQRVRAVAGPGARLLHVAAEPFLDVLEEHFEMAFGLLGSLARPLIVAGREGQR